MSDYKMFKNAFNGFDKDAVLTYIDKQQSDYDKKIADMQQQILTQKKTISGLTTKLVRKDNQIERIQAEIETKYQRYIDNYQQIGELLYESKMKGEQIIEEARGEADQIIAEAEAEAERRMSMTDFDIDAKIEESQQRYQEVRDEIDDIVGMFNDMRRNFIQSYKEVHRIVDQLPDSMSELKEHFDEDEEELPEFDSIDLDDDDDDFDPTDSAEETTAPASESEQEAEVEEPKEKQETKKEGKKA